MRYFECVDDSHCKFWYVQVIGPKLLTVYGKIGTAGLETVKHYHSFEMAEYEAHKLIVSKLRKGYIECKAIDPILRERIRMLVGDIKVDLKQPIEGDVDLV